MPRERIAGVVLAAGLSSRMGTNKMLLQLGGTSVVRRAVGTALTAGLDPVVAVVGHESGRIRAELEGLACTVLENADYARGMNTSLRAGIRALPDDVEGAVVLLGDMPLVDAEMLRSLAERFRRARPKLVVSTYGEVLAPPILYARELFAELRALDDEACGKSVVRRHRGEAEELPWPAERLTDLDVPEDLHRVGLQCSALRAPPVAGQAGSSVQCSALRAPPVAGQAGSSDTPKGPTDAR
jgi:molybdenum cofactor cytidylyltransferase